MAEQDSDLEKTELPSQRKLDRAREEGQVARSRELSTFLVMLAGGAGLWLMGAHLVGQLIVLLRSGLTLERELVWHPEQLLPHLADLSLQALWLFAPFLLLLLLVAAFSPMLMNGWLFSLKPLQPNFGKLDPLKGMARMFSVNSLVELAKAIGKSLVVGGIGGWVVWHNRDAVLLLAGEPITRSLPHLSSLLWWSFAAIMLGMLLIVAIDVPFQLWEHSKKLKMTKEEVRQEAKETEGDPQVKGRIRSMQREVARRRMMAAVPTADVVVTNPTHYAVALKYAEGGMRAPVVVAKGADLLAARIRELAAEHRVPILEAPPLARALHRHCEAGDAIPEALYTAVAEVLAWVYQLRRAQQGGAAMPAAPRDLPVPQDMDPAAKESAAAADKPR